MNVACDVKESLISTMSESFDKGSLMVLKSKHVFPKLLPDLHKKCEVWPDPHEVFPLFAL